MTNFYATANNIETTTTGHAAGSGSLAVAAGTGSGSPSPSAPWLLSTFLADGTPKGIYAVTGRAGDTYTGLTLVGGVDAPLPAGSLVRGCWTAENAAQVASAVNALESAGFLTSAPVSSVAGKTGAVTLAEGDIANLTADLASLSSSIATNTTAIGLRALDSAVVHNSGAETIAGAKTFSSTIVGNISGNAATVTNGVYTTGAGTVYLTPTGNGSGLTGITGSQISGNIAGSAANVTGTVAVTNGGTGQATANAAFNALAPGQATNSGKFLTTDGANASWATVPPGGSTGQVQYNNAGAFAGSANLAWDNAAGVLGVAGKVTAFKSANPSDAAEFYAETDPLNASVRATFVTPASSGGRVYVGSPTKGAYSLNFNYCTLLEGIASLESGALYPGNSNNGGLHAAASSQQFWSSYYTILLRGGMAGSLSLANTPVDASAASVEVLGTIAATPVLVVKGAASQAGSLQEWRNASGVALASLSASGGLVADSVSVANTVTFTGSSSVCRLEPVSGSTSLLKLGNVNGTNYCDLILQNARLLANVVGAPGTKIGFGSLNTPTGNPDTAIERVSAAVMKVTNGSGTLAKLQVGTFQVGTSATAGFVLVADASGNASWATPRPLLQTATDGPTVTFDLSLSDKHIVTLAGNRTLALSNVAVGQGFTIVLKQDATGSRTVTWFSGISWPGGTVPTLTTTAGKTDIFRFLCTASGAYLGTIAGQNL